MSLDNWLLRENTQAEINALARPTPVYYVVNDDGTEFTAMSIGEKVGGLELAHEGNGYWLDDVEVAVNYRRAGIGTQLMRMAAARHGVNFLIPMLGHSGQHPYWLTADGARLATRCINLGIITIDQCSVTPPPL